MYRKHRTSAPAESVLSIRRAVQVSEQAAANAHLGFDVAVFAKELAAVNQAQNGENPLASSVATVAFDALMVAAGYTHSTEFSDKPASFIVKTAKACGKKASSRIGADCVQVLRQSELHRWEDSTPVPPAVFGPLWPEGPPADWPALPKPTKLTLTVQVPDHLDDATVREKLKTLTTALARLNVAGGGHGLDLVRPIDFTQEQERGRADVVEQETRKPKGRGHAQGGR